MLLEMSGKITPEIMKSWSQSKNNTQLWTWLVIEVKSDAVKSNIAWNLECKVHESRQIGSGQIGDDKSEHWHFRNQRTKMNWNGEFNSDDHYIYYCGQESLRRNVVAIIVNKRVQNAVLGCNLKNDRMISVRFQGKPFSITVILVYDPTSNAEEQFYEDLQDLLGLTPKKRCPFRHRGLECKSRKSRDTWSNRQVWPWSTKLSRAKANWVFPREQTGHSIHPLPTKQEKTLYMDITRWSTP